MSVSPLIPLFPQCRPSLNAGLGDRQEAFLDSETFFLSKHAEAVTDKNQNVCTSHRDGVAAADVCCSFFLLMKTGYFYISLVSAVAVTVLFSVGFKENPHEIVLQTEDDG